MNPTLTEILSLTNEAAALVQRGKLSYANDAAQVLLGAGCVGKSTAELFGREVAGSQCGAFVASVPLAGRSCILRISRVDEGQLFFLCPDEQTPIPLNEPMIAAGRSALMSINCAADLLRARTEPLDDPEINAGLDSLSRAYHRMMRLSGNASFVLAYSRGAALFQPLSLDLGELCASCIDAVRHHFPGVDWVVEKRGKLAALADPALFKLLLMNLLSNCLLHASGLHRVRADLSEHAGQVFLSVSDDGCGILQEQLARVFDRYRHGFNLSQMAEGAGFGLSVARGVAQLHGGALLLESRPEQGTTVHVSFQGALPGAAPLRSPEDGVLCSARALCTGLADCLPEAGFSALYAD